MADYFVKNGGDGSAPTTWAGAYGSLQTALTAASTNGDRVILQYDGVPAGDKELASDTTFSFAANVSLICSTNSGSATVTPTVMGTSNWIGNSTTNRGVVLAGAFACYVYGLTIRTAGSTADNIQIGGTNGSIDYLLEDAYLWSGNTATGGRISLGAIANINRESYIRLINPTFRFGHASQGLVAQIGRIDIEGGSISASGSTPTQLLRDDVSAQAEVIFTGVDLSLITATLVPDQSNGYKKFTFQQCKLGAGVTVMAAQTSSPNRSSCDVYVIDCDSGDNHYQFQHHNALGSLTADTSIYANDGAAYSTTPNRYSWKIVTTANATFATPYMSPWVSVHHEGTSAITPNFECVRSGSSTAYTNNELGSCWFYKGTSGFTIGTMDHSDWMSVGGTPAAQTTGALGAGDWTGENATSWFGKLSPTGTITPAEIGDLAGRIFFGAASSTVYVDPTIRGRS